MSEKSVTNACRFFYKKQQWPHATYPMSVQLTFQQLSGGFIVQEIFSPYITIFFACCQSSLSNKIRYETVGVYLFSCLFILSCAKLS